MLTQALPSSSVAQYINGQAQVFTDMLSLSTNDQEVHPGVQIPNYVKDLRNAFGHLEIQSKKAVEGFSGVGASGRVSPAAQKMRQLIETKADSENGSEALLTWTAILRLRDFLENTIHNRQADSGKNPSGVWLSTFAKSQFQACTALVEEELMKVLPATLNAAEIGRVQSVFNSVLQFELALLDSAYARNQPNLELTQQSSSPWHPSNIIFTTDFDDTCTVVDSSETLVRAAEVAATRSAGDFQPGKLFQTYAAALGRHSDRTRKTLYTLEDPEQSIEVTPRLSGRDETSDDLVPGMDPLLKPSFDSIVKTSSFPSSEDIGDVPFDDAGLRKALQKLSDLEVLCNQDDIRSPTLGSRLLPVQNQDVISAGVLSGSTKEVIKAEAKKVVLRANCPRVLQQLVEVGTAIHIVSANWSRDLVTGGLPDLPKGKLFVHCNNLLFDESGVTTGAFEMNMVDAFDKEQMLRALRNVYNTYPGQKAEPQTETPVVKNEKAGKMLVYMGDSHTDLLGLLEADLGIVIGASLVARRVMALYGIQLLPIVEASAYISLARLNGSERSWRRSGILFEAQGWADVEACLFGVDSPPPSSAKPLKLSEETPEDQSVQQQSQFDTNDFSQERPPPVNLELVQVAC